MARIKHYNPDTQQWEYSDISSAISSEHENNKNNPHEVTAEQVGALPLSGGSVTGPIRLVPEPTYDEDGNPIISMNPYGDYTYIDKGELSIGGSKITGSVVYQASTGVGFVGHSGVTRFLSVGDNVYISNIPDPIESDEVANKGYVDLHKDNVDNPHGVTAAQVGALSKTGGSMSGDIYMDGNNVANAANVSFSAQNADGDNITVLSVKPVLVEEDNSVYLYLQDEYNGFHTVGIQNVASPIEGNDAATKSYVDEEIVTSINAIPQIYSSTSEPNSAVGKDGDIWIVYS